MSRSEASAEEYDRSFEESSFIESSKGWAGLGCDRIVSESKNLRPASIGKLVLMNFRVDCNNVRGCGSKKCASEHVGAEKLED